MSRIPDVKYAATVDGMRIAYEVLGEGPNCLVLSMNAGFAIDLVWDEPVVAAALARLSSITRLIVFDLCNFGSSSRVDAADAPTVQAWMDAFRAVLDDSGVARASVMAWGDGAHAAILFAATSPDRVENLILINGYACFRRTDDDPSGMPRSVIPKYLDAIRQAWGHGGVTEVVAPSLIRDAVSRQRWARNERLSADPVVMAAMTGAAMESDVTDILQSVQAPTLLISRADDRHVRSAHSRFLSKRIPRAKLVELPGNDHVPFCGDFESLFQTVQSALVGEHPPPILEHELATVLFTDIVGSTATAVRLGDEEWGRLLTLHHEAVRRELELFRGQEVDTAGDGFLAVFDGPVRAIRCALSIRDQLQSIGIAIRAGIHTGEVLRSDSGVSGVAVHIGARVAALAGQSEILVSRTVADLVVGSRLTFSDRGEHELKGIPGKWQVLAVNA